MMEPCEESPHTFTSLGKTIKEFLPSGTYFLLVGATVAWIYIAFIIGNFAAWAIPLWALVTLVPAIVYSGADKQTKLTRRLIIALGWIAVLFAMYLIFLFAIAPWSAD